VLLLHLAAVRVEVKQVVCRLQMQVVQAVAVIMIHKLVLLVIVVLILQ
jgi:hypothetical protein